MVHSFSFTFDVCTYMLFNLQRFFCSFARIFQHDFKHYKSDFNNFKITPNHTLTWFKVNVDDWPLVAPIIYHNSLMFLSVFAIIFIPCNSGMTNSNYLELNQLYDKYKEHGYPFITLLLKIIRISYLVYSCWFCYFCWRILSVESCSFPLFSLFLLSNGEES